MSAARQVAAGEVTGGEEQRRGPEVASPPASSVSAEDVATYFDQSGRPVYTSPVESLPQTNFPARAFLRHAGSPASIGSALMVEYPSCPSPQLARGSAPGMRPRGWAGSVTSFDSCPPWATDTEAGPDACDGDSYWDVRGSPAASPSPCPSPSLANCPVPGQEGPLAKQRGLSLRSAHGARATQGSPTWVSNPPPPPPPPPAGELSTQEAAAVAQCLAACASLAVCPPLAGGASQVTFLIDAEEYYSALLFAISRAQHSVCIMGWMFSAYTHLSRTQPLNQALRLDLVLQQKAREGVRVRLLLCSEYGEVCDQSGDHRMSHVRSAASAARALNMLHRNVAARPDAPDAQEGQGLPGHEKLAVIDGAVAFFGGLDVTVGRFDTRSHPCTAPGAERCIGRDFNNPKIEALALELHIDEGGHGDPFGCCLRQHGAAVRQPSHGVMAVGRGPVAGALQQHFDQRWAERSRPADRRPAAAGEGSSDTDASSAPPPAAPSGHSQTFAKKQPVLPPAAGAGAGRAAGPKGDAAFPPTCLAPSGTLQCQFVAGGAPSPAGERPVEDAIARVVEAAQSFLFIETKMLLLQQGGPLFRALVSKLRSKLLAAEPFRCYVVMPLFADAGHASHSATVQQMVLNDILDAVCPRSQHGGLRQALRDTLVLCGLQSVGRTPASAAGPGRLMTEQIAVESRLVIADDRLAAMGSADWARQSLDPGSKGALQDYTVVLEEGAGCSGGALRELRKQLWREHLWGCGASPSAEESGAIEDPGTEAAWNLWTTRAATNSWALAEVFPNFPNPRRMIAHQTGPAAGARQQATCPRQQHQLQLQRQQQLAVGPGIPSAAVPPAARRPPPAPAPAARPGIGDRLIERFGRFTSTSRKEQQQQHHQQQQQQPRQQQQQQQQPPAAPPPAQQGHSGDPRAVRATEPYARTPLQGPPGDARPRAPGRWEEQSIGKEEKAGCLDKVRGQLVLWPFTYLCQELIQALTLRHHSRSPAAAALALAAATAASAAAPSS